MSDEDELEDLVADALETETLMGWDGDPCLCAECVCPRFLDGSDPMRCTPCQAGDHWDGDRPDA